ncbi:MAG: aminodeoxychorismate lyase [Aldersonia sp.]|nr:aminodeoxychorismate lyase [Aldersonia sp.]
MADRVLVTLDGAVLDPDKPLLTSDDMGALRGDGVFETLLVRNATPCNLERHLKRLARSAEMLELPEPDLEQWSLAAALAAQEWDDGEGMMRWVLTRGRESGGEPTAYLTVNPVPERVARARADGIRVMTLPRGQSVDLPQVAPWQLLGAKTLSYATNMAALRFAKRYDVDDVIFVSSEGRVLEGPRSTVVIAEGNTLRTPPPSHGVLPGTTQQAMFDAAEEHGFDTAYAPLFPADLITADGVWLVSSVALAVPVRALDGLPLPESRHAAQITRLVESAMQNKSAEDTRKNRS